MFILIVYYYLVINFYGIENGISETVNRIGKKKEKKPKTDKIEKKKKPI
jgi:hypothetical protein